LMVMILVWIDVTDAVMSGNDEPPPRPRNSDYSAGIAAFENANWQSVIEHMSNVVARQPWNDNAYNLMGFAYRKLGDFPRALAAYQQALDLNPHHRGALEYLGETYLVMGCLERANEVLRRLETACERVDKPSGSNQESGMCEEWTELKAAIEAVPSSEKRTCSSGP